MLRAVPLKSLLEWLSKLKGPNLVEATVGVVPEKALVLATTRCMLYGEYPPYMGVGLVYKPHYVSMESFSIAYMHLNVWHAAASSEDLGDKLDSSRFVLVSVSAMSDVVPVAMPHPVFLDMGSKEVVEKTGEPLAPLWFWGFRLHTVWSRPPGGEPVHQIAFPCLRGDVTTPMLEYEPEKFSQSLLQGPKMSINLQPSSRAHWNIESNLILTLTMDTYQWRLEAKRADQDPERESAGEGSSCHGQWQQGCVPNGDCTPGRKRLGDHTRHRRTHSCPPPPDNTRDGRHEGGRASGCPHPYGGVCQITIYPV